METQTVRFPKFLNAARANGFVRLLKIYDCEVCILDFGTIERATPFGILMLATALKMQLAQRSIAQRRARGLETEFGTFAAHIGFFRYLGIQQGKEPGEARGSERYLPINTWDINELRRDAGALPFGEVVSHRARELAGIMTQATEGPTFSQVHHSFQEILRNAVEHSRGTNLLFCAQYYPTTDEVELAVLDDGRGLAASLRDNPDLAPADDLQAARLALKPGVTSVTVAQDELGEWHNSGFGLYMASGLCAKVGGEFRIISGNACLRVTSKGQEGSAARYSGTAVQMKWKVARSVVEAQRVQSDLQKAALAATRSPSASSLGDF